MLLALGANQVSFLAHITRLIVITVPDTHKIIIVLAGYCNKHTFPNATYVISPSIKKSEYIDKRSLV